MKRTEIHYTIREGGIIFTEFIDHSPVQILERILIFTTVVNAKETLLYFPVRTGTKFVHSISFKWSKDKYITFDSTSKFKFNQTGFFFGSDFLCREETLTKGKLFIVKLLSGFRLR